MGLMPPSNGHPPRPERLALDDVDITRTDVLCVGPIMAYSIFFLATTFAVPSLIGTHPLLLSALRGSTSSLIAVGARIHSGTIPAVLALLAPLPIMIVADPFYYWAGRRYGRWILDHLAGKSPRQRRRAARTERFFARWGVLAILFAYFIPLPAALFYVAAGEARMPFWLFAVADVAGTLMWVSIILTLGWRLGDRANAVAQGVSHYGLIITVALIIVYAGFAIVRSLRRPTAH